jgi:formylglycine-generating enzyme required for sulfatase activity
MIGIAAALGIYYYPRPFNEIRAEMPPPAGTDVKEVKNSLEMRLARIPAGKFLMGSHKEEVKRNEDETQHEVVITKAFYLGVFEVTQGQYEKVMGKNPAFFCAGGRGKQRVEGRSTADYPVENVSWLDAVEFCKNLSAKEKKTYRLPTEAEWEYACRAGTKTVFHTGNDFNSNLANINGLIYNSYGKEEAGPFWRCTTKVGEYKGNAFGLYDMHGNVQEWCADWYAADYYTKGPKEDPQGPSEGTQRVLRGGGWPSSAMTCRSAFRNHLAPDEKSYTSGFRVVLEVGR